MEHRAYIRKLVIIGIGLSTLRIRGMIRWRDCSLFENFEKNSNLLEVRIFGGNAIDCNTNSEALPKDSGKMLLLNANSTVLAEKLLNSVGSYGDRMEETDLIYSYNSRNSVPDQPIYRSRYFDIKLSKVKNAVIEIITNDQIRENYFINIAIDSTLLQAAKQKLTEIKDIYSNIKNITIYALASEFDRAHYQTSNLISEESLMQCFCHTGNYGKTCNAPLSSDENHQLLISGKVKH